MEKEHIVTLILGLLVAAIAFGFITSTDSDNTNTEVCRQSVIVRDTIPNVEVRTLELLDLKEKYPLNCQTQVLNINYEDKDKATKEVLNSIVECWYMFGNGKLNPLTSNISGSTCSICTRVHFDKEVEDYYIANPINLKESLNSEWKNDITYKSYLTAQVNGALQNYYIFTDSYNSENILKSNKYESGVSKKLTNFTLPEKIDVSKGDFFITFRYFRYKEEYHYADILFFPFDEGNSFNLLTEKNQDGFIKSKVLENYKSTPFPVCEVWEGVPA